MKSPRLPQLIGSFLVTLALSACNVSLAADVTPPPNYQPSPVPSLQPASQQVFPLTPPNPDNGAGIYAEKCAPCHGDSGMGDGPRAAQLANPVPALAEVGRSAVPAAWFQIVTQGNLERFMPPFASLSDGERWDVVAYALTLGTPGHTLQAGAALYVENCAECHGGNGRGGAGVDFSDPQWAAATPLEAIQGAVRLGVPPEMPAYGEQMSAAELWAVSAWTRNLSFANAGELAAAPPAEGTPVSGTPAAALNPHATALAPSDTLTLTEVITNGIVQGKVTNGSTDAAPAGITVTLHAFDEMQTVLTRTVTTDPEGVFEFDSIEMKGGRVFLATAAYGGAAYGSEIATIITGTTQVDLPIEVFDATRDTSALSADRLHLFFEFTESGALRVIQLYILSNNGKETILIPGDTPDSRGPVVKFTLPEGASALEFQDGALGERFIEQPGGFADTAPVRPGSGVQQILFSYELPYDRKLELAQPLSLATDAIIILAPANSLKVTGEGVEDAGARDVEGTAYQMYSAGQRAAGDTLRLTISGSPTPATSGAGLGGLVGGDRTSLLIGLGALGVALAGVGLWLYRRGALETAAAPAAEPVAAPLEDREALLDAILALDDLYREGKLAEDAYRQRRAELKDRLRQIP